MGFDKFYAALNDAWGFPVSVAAQDLEYGHPDRLVSLPGGLTLDFAILKYASWMRDVRECLLYVHFCSPSANCRMSYRNVHLNSHTKRYVSFPSS